MESLTAGLGKSSSQLLKEHIQKIRTSLNIPAGEPVPVAVGFLGWVLDKTEISDDPRLPAVLDEHPVAVWFAFGVDIEKWVDQVHEHDTRTRLPLHARVRVHFREKAGHHERGPQLHASDDGVRRGGAPDELAAEVRWPGDCEWAHRRLQGRAECRGAHREVYGGCARRRPVQRHFLGGCRRWADE
ncbi:hypothetical protein DFH08DRAFT_125192 [Mycena albidolilacea]|uniref:Uncharacterized protein n=1 Tax=Mycena albidolilacea TaxID=1033008 RepID=A0AAD7A5G4_9AGAR|nr:hypothetical protein DFH08DRAFT_125192 [Mycena albidolilacea]